MPIQINFPVRVNIQVSNVETYPVYQTQNRDWNQNKDGSCEVVDRIM